MMIDMFDRSTPCCLGLTNLDLPCDLPCAASR